MSKTSKQTKQQEHEAFIAVPVSLSQEPADEVVEEEEFSWAACGESCLLAILPCLLFIQFGVAYLTDNPPKVHWMIVNSGIVCFIASALFFRRSFNEPESLVALIPEVLIDVILGLILFEKTEIAAMIMFASIIGMGAASVSKYLMSSPEEEVVVCNTTRRGDCNA